MWPIYFKVVGIIKVFQTIKLSIDGTAEVSIGGSYQMNIDNKDPRIRYAVASKRFNDDDYIKLEGEFQPHCFMVSADNLWKDKMQKLDQYPPVSTHREDCRCPFINLGLVHKPACSFYRLGEWS